MQPIDLKRNSRTSSRKATNTKAAKAFRLLPRMHLVVVGGLSLALATTLMLPSKETQAKRQQEIVIPALAEALETADHVGPTVEPEPTAPIEPETIVREETVKSGDNLSLLFKRAGLTDRDMMEVLAAENGKKLAALYPGHTVAFTLSRDGKLEGLTYTKDRLNSFSFTRADNLFTYSEQKRTPDVQISTRSGVITESLFLAGKEAQLDDRLVMELASIFGWDIDFVLDIRQGDSFKVAYEESYIDGEKIGNGNIVAAEFTNQNKTYRAVRYEDANGNVQYYTPAGDTMRKEFLRTPIEFARISSPFNLKRKHPVLNKIRAHKGTDYAAARGTPIKAAGDGKVIFAGRKGGYGNVVIIQHGQTYKTLYAHISKFRKGIRAGARVKQGQTIAYVGSTGLATGPHLHYEFYVNGSVRNPVTVKLPKAKAIAKAELPRFLNATQPLLAELDPTSGSTKLADSHTISTTKNL